jgi:hypothetical protein
MPFMGNLKRLQIIVWIDRGEPEKKFLSPLGRVGTSCHGASWTTLGENVTLSILSSWGFR